MIGIVALAAATFVAAFAIATYEAWWPIGLVVFGVIVLAVQRSSLQHKAALVASAGLIGSIVVGAAAGWMVLLGVYPAASPCDASCFDNRVLLLPGAVVLIVALSVAMFFSRRVLRALRTMPAAGSVTDPLG